MLEEFAEGSKNFLMKAVLYLSLTSVTVLTVLIHTKNLQRKTKIAAWTVWGFFTLALCVYLAVFLMIFIEEME